VFAWQANPVVLPPVPEPAPTPVPVVLPPVALPEPDTVDPDPPVVRDPVFPDGLEMMPVHAERPRMIQADPTARAMIVFWWVDLIRIVESP
jgi:hypothetical protein